MIPGDIAGCEDVLATVVAGDDCGLADEVLRSGGGVDVARTTVTNFGLACGLTGSAATGLAITGRVFTSASLTGGAFATCLIVEGDDASGWTAIAFFGGD